MPIIAIIVGAMLLDLAARGTEHEFALQLGSDFSTGSKFWAWAVAILVLGSLGYVDSFKRFAYLPLGLVILVMVLANGGFYTRFSDLVTHPPTPAPSVPLSTYSSGSSGQAAAASSSGGGGGSDAASAISTVGEIAGIAALAFSDERLKTDVVLVGQENGFNLYEFNYRHAPGRYRGVMAQEVARTHPQAVVHGEDGFLGVMYPAIGVTFARVAP